MTIELVATAAPLADADKVDLNFTTVAGYIDAINATLDDHDVRISNLGNPVNGGAELVVVDDYPTIEDAQAAARARSGELFFRAHEYEVNLTVQHRDIISGESRYNTILKAAPGSNASVITGYGAAGLFNYPTYSLTDGANNVVLKNFTIDGNMPNNPTAGCGIAIWGYGMHFHNLYIRNCRHDGMRTQWGDGSVSMEGTFRDIVIDGVGYHGWRFNGPHDSFVENLMVIDASQAADNGFNGIQVDPFGNGRFINAHVWHRSTTTNRCWAAFSSSGGCEVEASHFEGCRTQQVRHNGAGDRISGSLVYAPFGVNGTALVVFNGGSNQHIGNRYSCGLGDGFTNDEVYGMQFGDANQAWNNQVEAAYFHGFHKRTPFNFYNSGGQNNVQARGYAAPGGVTTFAGTVQASDSVDYHQNGTLINYRKPRSFPTFASNAAAASGGVPVQGLYILSGTNALTVRV